MSNAAACCENAQWSNASLQTFEPQFCLKGAKCTAGQPSTAWPLSVSWYVLEYCAAMLIQMISFLFPARNATMLSCPAKFILHASIAMRLFIFDFQEAQNGPPTTAPGERYVSLLHWLWWLWWWWWWWWWRRRWW